MTWRPIETIKVKKGDFAMLWICETVHFGEWDGRQWTPEADNPRVAYAAEPTMWWDFGDGKLEPDPPEVTE